MAEALPRDEAHLWYAEPASVTPALAGRYLELLSPGERERHARFAVPDPALEFLLGRALLRSILGGYLGVEPGRVGLRLGARGKPALDVPAPELDFSLSHSRGLVACLVASGCDAGLDVEDTERAVEASSLAERFFDASESEDIARLPEAARSQRFFEYWTLKEACLKALGAGLAEPLDRFRFCFGAKGEPILLPGRDAVDEWHVSQLRLEPRFLLATALRSRVAEPARRRIVLRRILPLDGVLDL